MPERSPQHVEAMGRWKAQVGALQKFCSVVAVLGVTELFLFAFGADSTKTPAWETSLIGGICALVVGWFVFPVARYSWCRLTYNGRHALLEVRQLRESLSGLTETETVTESDRFHLADSVRDSLAEELLNAEPLYNKINVSYGELKINDIEEAMLWIPAFEANVRTWMGVDAVAELRVSRLANGRSGVRFPMTGDEECFRTISTTGRYVDWIENRLRLARE